MGNLVNTFIGGLLVYYIQVKNKLSGSGNNDHTDSLLSTEEKKENSDIIVDVKKGSTGASVTRNEYQLLKSGEEYEFLKDKQDNQLIDEISKEIKNVNIEFDSHDDSHNNKERKGKDHDEHGLDNLDDLKMQILSEHEDN
jgi:hypothetical protein